MTVPALEHFEQQMVGPIQDLGCAFRNCGKPKTEHRVSFMDFDRINHDFEEPPLLPLEHECVPAMVATEWHCHLCGHLNDVWGTGATESYMECGSCFAWSWLDFDPDGFEKVLP